MKDGYSFHAGDESLDATYADMEDAYRRIFAACGLRYTVVEADTGTIGGSFSHEFMVLAETGESAVASCGACGYGANVEKAETRPLAANAAAGAAREATRVATPGASSVAEVAKVLGVAPRDIVKTLIYVTEKGLVAALIRGDRTINEVKLQNHLDVEHLTLAGEEKVREASGAPVGFAGPMGLAKDVRLVADRSARDLRGFACGANEADMHWTGVEWDRDVKLADWGDFLLVEEGDACPRCGAVLRLSRGIEVGHIFKLGTKYSTAMQCSYTDEEGRDHPMPMGCYGLGIGRTVAAAIEQNHDADGIVWPLPLAPYEVLVQSLNPNDEAVRTAADRLYAELGAAGFEVLYDDRDERPGVKFKDADLVGIPLRVTVGARSLAEGKIEVSLRQDRVKIPVAPAEVVAKVRELAAILLG
jgi:prolyl-tRNA synthetase